MIVLGIPAFLGALAGTLTIGAALGAVLYHKLLVKP